MAQYMCSTADRPYRRRRPADVLRPARPMRLFRSSFALLFHTRQTSPLLLRFSQTLPSLFGSSLPLVRTSRLFLDGGAFRRNPLFPFHFFSFRRISFDFLSFAFMSFYFLSFRFLLISFLLRSVLFISMSFPVICFHFLHFHQSLFSSFHFLYRYDGMRTKIKKENGEI